METDTKKTTSPIRLTTLISAAYLGVVLVAALLLLGGTPSTPRAEADTGGNCPKDVCQNDSAVFTVNLQPKADQTVQFTTPADNKDIKKDFVNLSWETTGVADKSQLSASGDWSPTPATLFGRDETTKRSGATRVKNLSPGQHSFTITASDAAGNETASSQVTVNLVPTYTLTDVTITPDQLSGTTGSTVTVSPKLNPFNFASGDEVDLTVASVPQRDGNNLFNISLNKSQVDPTDNTVEVTVEVAQPIYKEGQTYTATITGSASNGAPDNDPIILTIKPDAFSPRTIEEF